MEKNIPRLIISAPQSGGGKTTVTAALISALMKRGLAVQSFKCGPDYIDPMLHSHITGRSAYHTDPFFSDTNNLRSIAAEHSAGSDIAVIEGAMGFYDGLGCSCEASTYTVSAALNAPVILVVEPKGMGCSVAAMVNGFIKFKENSRIKGVIFNRIKPEMYGYYQKIITEETDTAAVGFIPEISQAKIESRHLGLMTPEEIVGLDEKINILGEKALETLDIKAIMKIARSPEYPKYKPIPKVPRGKPFRLGIARDNAFCFYYAENIDILKELGAEIVEFSPISDSVMPDGLDGIYLGGGYPELYLEALSKNHSFIDSLREYASNKTPILAECGGFMYILQGIKGKDGKIYPMASLTDGIAELGDRLCRFGYITLTANEDTMLAKKGMSVKAHEFHYSDSTENGCSYTAAKCGGRQWNAIVSKENIHGGFPHLYFPSNIDFAVNFAERCRENKNL